MMSFGIVRQSISYPDEVAQLSLIKHVFLKPYFMIYGEVYAGEIDRKFSDWPWGQWLTESLVIDRKFSDLP